MPPSFALPGAVFRKSEKQKEIRKGGLRAGHPAVSGSTWSAWWAGTSRSQATVCSPEVPAGALV